MDSETGPLALWVDEVCGVRTYHAGDLKPVPAIMANSQRSHTVGVLAVDERTFGVLDRQRLLNTLGRSLS